MILSLKKQENPKLVCICCYTNCVTLFFFCFFLRDSPQSAATRLSVPETPGSLVGHFMRLCVCVNHSITWGSKITHFCGAVFSTQPAGCLPKPSASRVRPLPDHLEFSQGREAEQARRLCSGIWHKCDYTEKYKEMTALCACSWL